MTDSINDTFVVFKAVTSTNNTEIDITLFHLSEINLLWGKIHRRLFFKNKRFKELAKQNIRPQVMCKHLPLYGEFSLHTADEYFNAVHNSFLQHY